jgi:hypothetical protein
MRQPVLYAIVASQDGATARPGWISHTTGISYCGICLGAQVRPVLGDLCSKCGGCVVGVFDATDDFESIRNAWRFAWPYKSAIPKGRFAKDGPIFERREGCELRRPGAMVRKRKLK